MFNRLDQFAIAGYRFAAYGESMPRFESQIDIDAFNAGIRNFNAKNNAAVPSIFEGLKRVHIQGSNNGLPDKELAIVGA